MSTSQAKSLKSELILTRILRSSDHRFSFTLFVGDAGMVDAASTTYLAETARSCQSDHLSWSSSRGEVELCEENRVETQCKDWALYHPFTRREVGLVFC